jgi:hypothetical protein
LKNILSQMIMMISIIQEWKYTCTYMDIYKYMFI